ncbi:MAG: hypothetical protein IKL79_04775 [Clostridia bacterium]|nr:hypothetical protein [Clostridia bacterium]
MKKISIILLLALLINLFTACSQSTDKINEGNEDIIPSVKEEPETVKRKAVFLTSAEVKESLQNEWSDEDDVRVICFDDDLITERHGDCLNPYGHEKTAEGGYWLSGGGYECHSTIRRPIKQSCWFTFVVVPGADLFNIGEKLNHELQIIHIDVEFTYTYAYKKSQPIDPVQLEISDFQKVCHTSFNDINNEYYDEVAHMVYSKGVNYIYKFKDTSIDSNVDYGLSFEVTYRISTTYFTEELVESVTDIIFEELLSLMILVKTGG